MKFKAKFPNKSIEKKFEKALLNIPDKGIRERIINEIAKLESNPRPYGAKKFKKITPPIAVYNYTAEYRLRIGNYRVLYDVDDSRKIIWVYTLRKRNEKTYR